MEDSQAIVFQEEEQEESDPRLNRKKRQAFLPYYSVFSTRGTRRRSRQRLVSLVSV